MEALLTAFEVDQYPDVPLLASELGLSSETITNWFHNHRSRSNVKAPRSRSLCRSVSAGLPEIPSTKTADDSTELNTQLIATQVKKALQTHQIGQRVSFFN